jgi:hypothetical protein
MKIHVSTWADHLVKPWFKHHRHPPLADTERSAPTVSIRQAPVAKRPRFSIYDVYAQIFKIWRRKRFVLFIRLLSPQRTQCLIDVGGYPGFWTQHRPLLGHIDTLNLHPVTWEDRSLPEYHIQTLVGDGCALGIPDKSYDIAFSNSVIEHVGSWSRQQSFADEIRRVGKAVWVQTPAFACPIEPHYLAPFIHWLPGKLQKKIVRWLTPWGLISRPSASEVDQMVESIRLLTKREMRALFPDCRIYTERLLGFIPKSYIAVREAAG